MSAMLDRALAQATIPNSTPTPKAPEPVAAPARAEQPRGPDGRFVRLTAIRNGKVRG